MRLLKLKIHGLKAYGTTLDLEFVARQRVVKENSQLYELLPRVYQNNAMIFIGDNTSGKSHTIRLISLAMRMLEGMPLSVMENLGILEEMKVGERFLLETYFLGASQSLFKLETTIRKDVAFFEEETKFVIEKEALYEKESARIRSRKSLFEFQGEEPILTREGKAEDLPLDVSIVKDLFQEEECGLLHLEVMALSEEELLKEFLTADKKLLQFTAPHVQCICEGTLHRTAPLRGTSLRFHGMEPVFLREEKELFKYLSPGLMRSTILLHKAMNVLKHGGTLAVDGLEKDISKDKAVALLRLFQNPEVNLKGACLLATTLDPDLLDEIERNDAIYLLHHERGIQVRNLAELLPRNDLKKSEVYRSGTLPGTSPLKSRFDDLLKHLKEEE